MSGCSSRVSIASAENMKPGCTGWWVNLPSFSGVYLWRTGHSPNENSKALPDEGQESFPTGLLRIEEEAAADTDTACLQGLTPNSVFFTSGQRSPFCCS